MAFEVIANNLERLSDIKSLKLQSDEYAVTIFYYGDYKADIERGGCLAENLTVSCKPRREGFPLDCACGKVAISVPAFPIIFVDEIDELKRRLDIAKEEAAELQGILKKYFDIKEGELANN